ncbi:MAG: threonine dehydratase [Herbaspirillum sp.]
MSAQLSVPCSAQLPNRVEIEAASRIVYQAMQTTPQYSWPLINQELGCETWIKHENHTPVGAFKVRGGLVYFEYLRRRLLAVHGVISATRGNHGLSVGFAARRYGVQATIVVPHGNSLEKNAAMRALGVDVIEYGAEFQDSREQAARLAQERGLHMIPSFHTDLVAGIASYWMELFCAQPKLDLVLVPIGLGSGICAAIAARNALGLSCRIIGVVSAHALAYQKSFRAGHKVESPVSTIIADGVACRVPDDIALALIMDQVDDVVAVTDAEVAQAMRLFYTATHNVAEGAGALALAAAMQMKSQLVGRKVGLPLSGGNVDAEQFARILQGSKDGIE